ncbi:MAG: urease accessory protein UreD [Treponema sp.]|nr:urease accessory protein UreD [Treponema sp.]
MAGNRYPQDSEFFLRIKKGENVSIPEEIRFTAPFKITSPFYDNEQRLQVMLMSVSAGIMEGDTQNIKIEVDDGANLQMLSQSFEKIHKMESGTARRNIELKVGRDAVLIYTPLPSIPYALSSFSSASIIQLTDASSSIFYCDILSCGRVARGEKFAYTRYANSVRAYCADELIYSDNTVFEPEGMQMEGFCLFEGYTHLLGIFYFAPGICEKMIGDIREGLEQEEVKGGASITGSGGIHIRALADGSEPLINLEQKIKSILFDTGKNYAN